MNEKLNPQQKIAVEQTEGPLLIVAGAGTGKTTVITEKIAYLIMEKKIKADEVLALTFTDKAAGEMEERVDKLLPYGYVDLWVMTFHSFCERILQIHGLDIGLANDFKLLNQTDQWLLARENLDKFNLDYYRPLGNPTKFIHALIKHFSRCKDEEIWPGDYLKYAENLKINLDSMEASGGVALKHESIKTLKQDPLPPTAVVGLPLIKGESLKAPLLYKPASPSQGGDGVGGGNKEIDISEIRRLEEVANAYHVYQNLLLESGSLDFGDLINYTLKLFRERPNILKKYQEQFKYILVDEFQDTNFAQYELVKLLSAGHQNLTVVGDDDQSIYKFRGASVSNILQFKEDFPESKEIFLNQNYRSSQNILDLAYNFIQLNNPERLEVKLRNQKLENRNQELTKKLIANTNEMGIIEHLHFSSETEEVAGVINKIVELYNTESRGKENTQDLKDGDSRFPISDFRLPSSWNDFAILIRANNQAEVFINALRGAGIPYNFVASKGLYSKEIILDIFAYLKLLDNYHESLALWRVLNMPMVGIKIEDLMEITNFAKRKAISLFETCAQINLFNNIQPETKRKVEKILKLISLHTKLAKEKSIKAVILKFLEDFNYSQFLLAKNDELSFAFVNQLIKKIDDFQKSFADKSLKNFMRLIELEVESGEAGSLSKELEEGPEAVKIMTVHSAKGLEFKYVFIVNLVDKRFPSLERSETIEIPDALVKEIIPSGDIHLQEERRLFYVAMTRAKTGLFFTSAENYGGARKKKLSQFLYETGLSLKHENIKTLKQEVDNKLTINNQQLAINKEQKPLLLITHYSLPVTFSFSALKAYETCPYQYHLGYVVKIPTPGRPNFSFGKTMHTTLQRFFSLAKERDSIKQSDLFGKQKLEVGSRELGVNLPPLEELLKLYKESWIDDWYDDQKQKEEYRARGEQSLKNLYEQLKENGAPQVFALERDFNLKIGGYTIKGRIDRVDLIKRPDSQNSQEISNNSQNQTSPTVRAVEVIDYKTGTPKREKFVEKDQLLIYQMAGEEVFGWPVEKLTFYYLDNNSAVSFLGTAEDKEEQKGEILETIEKINSGDFSATPNQFKCKYCDFVSICKFREI
ncbi:MAG: UvrD-helicase domain-containing protein [Patescibacteria group bacterium]|nr:UvrD-helicase domain-containing protein [Patescibacteria group bacterium]